jgi:hypothetical protein
MYDSMYFVKNYWLQKLRYKKFVRTFEIKKNHNLIAVVEAR